jgi:hypothetical protein
MSTRIVRTAATRQPRLITTEPKQRAAVGVRFPDGRIIVPPAGVSVDDFARWNGIELAPKSKKPPAGLPHSSELDLADDPASSSYDEIIAISGSSAVPTLNMGSAIPTLGSSKTAASGFGKTPTEGYTALREVTRKHGSAFVGQLALTKINGKSYVKTADLEALASRNSRGSRQQQKNPAGAEAVVSKEIANATAARKRAWEARQKRVAEHERKQQRQYRPLS